MSMVLGILLIILSKIWRSRFHYILEGDEITKGIGVADVLIFIIYCSKNEIPKRTGNFKRSELRLYCSTFLLDLVKNVCYSK